MVLESRQTTVAYRCPQCGAGVMSVVNLFALHADMIKLKCDCGGSEMTLVHTKDNKVRFTVPCIFCPNPHHFTLSSHGFFDKEMFALPCPYSGMNIALMGDTDRVKAELARSELELLDLLEKSGIDSFEQIRKTSEDYANPEVVEAITYMLRELDEEGKIECNCPKDAEGDYELEFFNNIAKISCKRCGCKKEFKTDSISTSQELLSLDKLKLEF